MSAAIEVISLRSTDGSGTVKAYVDLKIGGITIKGAKIIQQENQKAWLGMPGIKTNHGWQNVIEIHSKELRQRVNDFVIAHWTNKGVRAPRRSEATWAATEHPAGGATTIHRHEHHDPRQTHVAELAARFEPDPEPPF